MPEFNLVDPETVNVQFRQRLSDANTFQVFDC